MGVIIPSLPPGAETDISVQLRSPATEGVHQSRYRLHTPNGEILSSSELSAILSSTGMPFGDIIWCIVTVEASGLLGITQQMNQMAGISSVTGHGVSHSETNVRDVVRTPPPHLDNVDLPEVFTRVPASSPLRADPPASPNGSCTLHQNISAHFIQVERDESGFLHNILTLYRRV